MPAVNNVLVVGGGLAGAGDRHPPRQAGRRRRPRRDQARRRRPRLRHHPAGQRAARAAVSSASGTRCRRPATPSTPPASARPTRTAPSSPRSPTPRPAAPTCPPPWACRAPSWPASWSTAPPRSASRSGFGTTFTELDAGRRRRRRRPSPTAPPAATTWSSAPTASAPGPAARSASTWRPKSVGMGIWRAFGPRPASVTRTDLYYGGPSYIAGYCPTGEDSLYAYIVEDAQDRSALTPEEQLATMKQLSRGLPRPVGRDPRDAHRPVAGQLHLVRDPRPRRAVEPRPGRAHRRRRAHLPAHPRPGRRQALEDAAVLAELLTERDALDQDLWDAFHARRFERAKTVVDASNQLAQWQLDHVQGDIPGLMRSHRHAHQPARLNPRPDEGPRHDRSA